MSDLANKVIVLTGGGDGIGRECALAYARAGAAVAILDRNMAAAESTAAEIGGKTVAIHADVSDGDAVKNAIATVLKKFSRIDAIHNNAGIAGPSKPLHETSEAEWDDLQRINLKSVYWTTRYGFEALPPAKGAS
jgi:meso-butanediol dehydrogenase / (S,S)-butanediol dehydrogenase / diacetyl reductase